MSAGPEPLCLDLARVLGTSDLLWSTAWTGGNGSTGSRWCTNIDKRCTHTHLASTIPVVTQSGTVGLGWFLISYLGDDRDDDDDDDEFICQHKSE